MSYLITTIIADTIIPIKQYNLKNSNTAFELKDGGTFSNSIAAILNYPLLDNKTLKLCMKLDSL